MDQGLNSLQNVSNFEYGNWVGHRRLSWRVPHVVWLVKVWFCLVCEC